MGATARFCTAVLLGACAAVQAQAPQDQRPQDLSGPTQRPRPQGPADRGPQTGALAIPSESARHAAEQGAEAWLAAVDAGRYGQSWTDASPLFRTRGTQEDWVHAVGAERKPLGAVKSRRLESARATRQLPGAPAGDYILLLYDTDFAARPADAERVTMTREPDGTWKVAGYSIRSK
jgi:hypothetical protein